MKSETLENSAVMETAKPVNAAAPDLTAYYGNRPLMWRNLGLILLLNLGWGVTFTVINPLIQLRLSSMGVSSSGLGMISAINSWVYSYAVMFFAWKSDHTVSRFGRRIPYLFISAPVIVTVITLFPFIGIPWILVGLALLQTLFMDIKAATIPLLNIDCMPRQMLARTAAPAAIGMGLVNFLGMRYGMRISEWSEMLPYLLAGAILTATTLTGGFLIKEPPVTAPTTEKFRPWSAMKVALKDRRALVLMVSVSLFQTFQILYGNWIWLYAKNTLHMSRMESGLVMSWGILVSVSMAFPLAWLIDRISPYKLLPFFCALAGTALWFALHITCPTDLIIVASLVALGQGLYGASDIMVYRNANPAEVGSVTSTNSCLRGLYNGCTAIFAGFLIQHSGGHYEYAFILGFILTSLGLVPLYFYKHLMSARQN
ncbi:MAG: MFS transporter [Chthoniobacteraceae bacterium]